MATASSPRTVSVTTDPTLISEPQPYVRHRRLKNNGATSIFLGASDVTAAGVKQGWEVAAGEEFQDEYSNGALYAIVAAGTADVKVWETQS